MSEISEEERELINKRIKELESKKESTNSDRQKSNLTTAMRELAKVINGQNIDEVLEEVQSKVMSGIQQKADESVIEAWKVAEDQLKELKGELN